MPNRLLTCRPGQAILTGKDKLVALKVRADYGQILVDTGYRLDLLYFGARPKQIFPGIFISVERIFSDGVFRVSIEEKPPSWVRVDTVALADGAAERIESLWLNHPAWREIRTEHLFGAEVSNA